MEQVWNIFCCHTCFDLAEGAGSSRHGFPDIYALLFLLLNASTQARSVPDHLFHASDSWNKRGTFFVVAHFLIWHQEHIVPGVRFPTYLPGVFFHVERMNARAKRSGSYVPRKRVMEQVWNMFCCGTFFDLVEEQIVPGMRGAVVTVIVIVLTVVVVIVLP